MAELTGLLHDASAIEDQIRSDRRAIHSRPELMYEERHTAELVKKRLTALDIPFQSEIGETGVIGLIEGVRPGPTVLLRADMDALPIEEESEHSFRSQVPAKMHACGHDAHTAMLLGAAHLLGARRAQLAGTVKLMFQPAEEGGGGAVRMIEQGLLEEPRVDAAFMLHVAPWLDSGVVATRPGPIAAGADSWTLTVEGKGGHGMSPELTVDPVVVAAYIITALQTVVSRECSPHQSTVLTVGSIVAGSAHNIIPDRAIALGTIRAHDPALFQQMEARLVEIAEGVARSLRAEAKVDFLMRYPPVVNDPAMSEMAMRVAAAVAGPANALGAEVVNAGDDFAFVLERVPGALVTVGVRDPSWGETRGAHTPRFDMDETVLPLGTAVYAGLALEYLDPA